MAIINKFPVLYVGQIDLDNVGRPTARPADDRRYSEERLIEAFAMATRESRRPWTS